MKLNNLLKNIIYILGFVGRLKNLELTQYGKEDGVKSILNTSYINSVHFYSVKLFTN
jgi:hypothetical protein